MAGTLKSNSQIEDEELQAKLKEAFEEVDMDKNGTISKDDLKKVCRKIWISSNRTGNTARETNFIEFLGN